MKIEFSRSIRPVTIKDGSKKAKLAVRRGPKYHFRQQESRNYLITDKNGEAIAVLYDHGKSGAKLQKVSGNFHESEVHGKTREFPSVEQAFATVCKHVLNH
jgi:hypothetical protein